MEKILVYLRAKGKKKSGEESTQTNWKNLPKGEFYDKVF